MEWIRNPSYTLGTPFNDPEILPTVIKNSWHVSTINGPQGGSTEPHWQRYLLYETLTEVVPSPNQTLDPPFSDAGIFRWVTCWYPHWTPGGSTEPHWFRYLLYETLTEVVPTKHWTHLSVMQKSSLG